MSNNKCLPLPPPIVNPNTYTGYHFAFDACGGFAVDQSFNRVVLATGHPKYYVTDSVQLFYSARTLNKKLGILKDASNINVVEALLDHSGNLINDNITLTTADLINGVNTKSVVSVGRLHYLYRDFMDTVNTYFGNPTEQFAALFSNASDFTVNNGVFDASNLIQVLNTSTFNIQGSYISDLSGSASIININDTIKYLLEYNIFDNRIPAPVCNNQEDYEADTLPPVRKDTYTIADGFMAGDNVFIPEGLTITLTLDIQSVINSYPAFAGVGSANLDAIHNQINFTSGYIKRSTTYSVTQIKQTTTIPILLLLIDTTLQNNSNYGKVWTIATNISTNGIVSNTIQPWLAISISTDGRYQTAITELGDIFISEDYGVTRTNVFNIGESPSNSIAISFTGQYQTASNGRSIYISNNYGMTWICTFTGGTSNIYVSISLTGMYQTLVSSGDTVYTSNDYGNTWNELDIDITHDEDAQNSLYLSIEAFPTAGVSLSYDGKYQTIAAENIYVSSDYGVTWKDISDPIYEFNDGNWQGVSLSSDGRFQTAIDNGGKVYISNDYGLTWTAVRQDIMQNKTWVSVSISATGEYQTILEQNGSVYLSNEYGANWYIATDPLVVSSKDWRSVSISSNALYQCAAEYNGQIYMSHVFTIND
jgi:BNR-Asp box repeat